MEQQPLVSLDTQLGPWAGYLNAYTTLIKERGYAPVSVQTQVQLITKFCEWLRRGHTEVHALDEIIVERFLWRHQSADSARRGDAAALFPFSQPAIAKTRLVSLPTSKIAELGISVTNFG